MVFKNGISYNIEKTWVSGRSEDGDAGGEGHTHSVLTEGTCKKGAGFWCEKDEGPGFRSASVAYHLFWERYLNPRNLSFLIGKMVIIIHYLPRGMWMDIFEVIRIKQPLISPPASWPSNLRYPKVRFQGLCQHFSLMVGHQWYGKTTVWNPNVWKK